MDEWIHREDGSDIFMCLTQESERQLCVKDFFFFFCLHIRLIKSSPKEGETWRDLDFAVLFPNYGL